MILTVAIFAVLLCSVQGNGNDDNALEAKLYMNHHKLFLSTMRGWMSTMTQNMKAQVEETTQNFQELPDTLIEDAKAELELYYANTLQEVLRSSAPQHCITAGQQQLEELQANNLNSFLGCKNLTQGVRDIIQMGLEISKLTVQILLTADEVINGFGGCPSINPFKFFYCTFNWVKDSLTDIYKSFEAVTEFTKHMASLISDLRSQISYCMHGGKANALLHHVQVLQSVQQCAAKQEKMSYIS